MTSMSSISFAFLFLLNCNKRLRMTLRRTRAARGRRTSYSHLLHGCSWMGEGMEVVVCRHARQSQEGLVAYPVTLEYFRVRGENINDIALNRLPGAQLWVLSSRNWSVFRGRP